VSGRKYGANNLSQSNGLGDMLFTAGLIFGVIYLSIIYKKITLIFETDFKYSLAIFIICLLFFFNEPIMFTPFWLAFFFDWKAEKQPVPLLAYNKNAADLLLRLFEMSNRYIRIPSRHYIYQLKQFTQGNPERNIRIAINYADEKYRKQQKLNTKTALKNGFDKAIEYTPNDLDTTFKEEYKAILGQKRGGGLWLWKPYIILKTLDGIKDGDYLFYSDSGSYFIDSIDHLIQIMERDKQEVMAFELPFIEKHWTKRDTFILMGCDKPEFTETNQRLSTFILLKKSNYTVDIINEFLKFAKDSRILEENDNILGYPNYAGYQGHREDQSIWSLLTKKYNIQVYRDPSDLGSVWSKYIRYLLSHKGEAYSCLKRYNNSDYPVILIHYRNGDLVRLVPRIINYVKFQIREFIQIILFGR
jgi:hypothetical protein